MKPIISIIVPTFNVENYIEALIESVKNQEFQNWEMIIVDDHSTDSTLLKAKKIAGTDNRIKILLRPEHLNKGGDVCRNFGMDISVGEYLVFIDGDDVMAPYCLSQRYIAMKNNPSLDFAIFPALTFKNQPLDYNIRFYGLEVENPIHGLVNKILPYVVWNNIYRREAIYKKGIRWDENLLSSQDADFNISCIINKLSYQFFYLPPDYFWRQTNFSLSQRIKKPEHARSNLYYFSKIYNLVKDDTTLIFDLKLLSLWIFNSLSKNSDTAIIQQFLLHDFFYKERFLRTKFKLMYNLISKLGISNYRTCQIIQFLFVPRLCLTRRKLRQEFPWNRKFEINLSKLVEMAKCKMPQNQQ